MWDTGLNDARRPVIHVQPLGHEMVADPRSLWVQTWETCLVDERQAPNRSQDGLSGAKVETLHQRKQGVGWQARLENKGFGMEKVLGLATSCQLVLGPAAAQSLTPGGRG